MQQRAALRPTGGAARAAAAWPIARHAGAAPGALIPNAPPRMLHNALQLPTGPCARAHGVRSGSAPACSHQPLLAPSLRCRPCPAPPPPRDPSPPRRARARRAPRLGAPLRRAPAAAGRARVWQARGRAARRRRAQQDPRWRPHALPKPEPHHRVSGGRGVCAAAAAARGAGSAPRRRRGACGAGDQVSEGRWGAARGARAR